MTLPSSGQIAASDINVELGRAAGAGFSLNATAERTLAGKASGIISFSNFHGKSSAPPDGVWYYSLTSPFFYVAEPPLDSGSDADTYWYYNGVVVYSVTDQRPASVTVGGHTYSRGTLRSSTIERLYEIKRN